MQQVKNIVKGPYEPQDNTVIWIDTSNPDTPIAKVHSNGEWKAVSGVDNLPTILNEILDSGHVIKASRLPEDGDSLDDVFACGFTLAEIEAAAKGKRGGVVLTGQNGDEFFQITRARYKSADNFVFGCVSCCVDTTYDTYFDFKSLTISYENDELYILRAEI